MCEESHGWVAYREGRIREAVELLERAVEHSGGHAREGAHLACALEARSRHFWRRRNDIDRARDVWQQVLDRFPRSPAAAQARHHMDLLPKHPHPPGPLACHGLSRRRRYTLIARPLDQWLPAGAPRGVTQGGPWARDNNADLTCQEGWS
ncbi:tetratricopeptide repeat protein [Streptomyces sp. NBC_00557]|uniref:tetratricopeptide repeat protein n=1 Tax=Streptomyces sp. NBC_00557 TaxID=2975776 RepID=UPI002E81A9F2|nr:hypothetical protein [Streptomyces sp. NBC_00557]WUC39292.1 tetratricopeptide repeat protein [Streptomyces sp. NBC_00557]